MKVLFLSHQADFLYGGEVVTLAFMRELQALGAEVHFASPEGAYHEQAREFAICHRISSRQFSRKIAALPGFVSAWGATRNELVGLVRASGINILHATSLKAMVYAWGAAGSVPVVWHHHDILPVSAGNSLWVKTLALKAGRILTPSNATRDSLLKAGVADKKVHVLNNGFRVGEWTARRSRAENSRLRIGVIGEISVRKGTDRLEGIIAALGRDPLITFQVIGEGLSDPAFAANLRKKLESFNVEFLGRRSEIKQLYQELDLLLVPSRQDPLPTVIVEAGLSGVPVVAARTGGIPEMILDGKNGFLFDNEVEAARAIRKSLAIWPALSRQARKFAEERYNIRALSKALIAHYQEVIRGA